MTGLRIAFICDFSGHNMMTDFKERFSVSFAKGDRGSLFLLYGWKSPETWGVKNSSTVSEMLFPGILPSGQESISINFYCKCHSEVFIYINENLVSKWTLSKEFDNYKIPGINHAEINIENSFKIKFCTSSPDGISLANVWIDGGHINESEFLSQGTLEKEDYIAQEGGPVFITGIPRSGTSITYKIINQLYGINNPSLIESFYYAWAFSKYKESWSRNCALSFLGDKYAGLFSIKLAQLSTPVGYSDITALSKIYYSLITERYGSNLIVDKTPDNIFYWRSIFSSFPNAKIIFCHRPPADIYASMRKRLLSLSPEARTSNDNQWLRIDCEAFAYRYLEYLQAFKNCLENYPQNTFDIDYDRFCSRDSNLIKQLAEFLGCERSRILDLIDLPIDGTVHVNSSLHGGVLFENKINAKTILELQELEMLEKLPDLKSIIPI